MPTPRKPRPKSRSALPPAFIIVYSPTTLRALGRELTAIDCEFRKRTIAAADARTRRLEQIARERRAATQQPREPLPPT
jgi:hypothetical protein